MRIYKSISLLAFTVAICSGAALYVAQNREKSQPDADFKRYIKTQMPDPVTRAKRNELKKRALINPVKVFQIGFSKCGTMTLFDFFNRNGVAAIHHDGGQLPVSIYNNFNKGLPLIPSMYRHYWLFTDMERTYADPQINIGMTMFKELDKQYPGSKFILNTRDKQAWLKSRAAQKSDQKDEGISTFLEVTQQLLNKSEQEVLSQWSAEWDEHHRAVKKYFKDRPDDLLVFDFDKDSPEKLTKFFKHNFFLDAKLFRHLNKTDVEAERKHAELVKRALINPVKVFQIGFSKCATVSLAEFFKENGVASVHHDYGKLADSIYKNFLGGKALISKRYKNSWVFTDMETTYDNPPLSIGMTLFKELDKQYPGSKFILNTRDKQAWLKSRSAHRFAKYQSTTLLEINQKNLNLSKQEVLAKWSREWDEHHIAVKEYFKDRPNDLLIFNIDTDHPEKLVQFFKQHFLLDAKKFQHLNKTGENKEQKLVAQR